MIKIGKHYTCTQHELLYLWYEGSNIEKKHTVFMETRPVCGREEGRKTSAAPWTERFSIPFFPQFSHSFRLAACIFFAQYRISTKNRKSTIKPSPWTDHVHRPDGEVRKDENYKNSDNIVQITTFHIKK